MTPPAPRGDSPAGRAYLDLRNLARRHDRDPSEYLTLYALEGFLTRLAISDEVAHFILKGGVLMTAFAERRPTRDIDLAGSGLDHDIGEVTERIKTIVGLEGGDGLSFDRDSVTGDTIREDADYPGVRVRLLAHLATAHIPLHVDVNFGDPIWPGPAETELPLLLGGTLRLRTYPDHMVLAEKIVTAIDRGTANTRWRDFVDIAAITGSRSIQQNHLAVAIDTVARHRRVAMTPMVPALDGLGVLAQRRWAAWRRKQRLEATTPEQFADLLDRCSAFADPVLGGGGDGVWSPRERAWVSPAAT